MATILLVDDEEQIRRLFRCFLENRGYTVMQASDGQEAMDYLQKCKPDLVVTDLVMPEKEGIELIMHLRDRHPDVPVFAVTGGGRGDSADYLAIARELGAARCFSKPVKLQELLTAVKECIAD